MTLPAAFMLFRAFAQAVSRRRISFSFNYLHPMLVIALFTTFRASAQRQALAAKAGLGRKNPKGEPAKGADSLKAETHPAFVRCTLCWAGFAGIQASLF